MKPLIFCLLIASVLTSASDKQTVTGAITDSMCADADHSRMRMGPTDAECTLACNKEHDAEYVLYDGNEIYTLSDQKTPQKFAGKKVTVTGTVDLKTKAIKVDSITPAQ